MQNAGQIVRVEGLSKSFGSFKAVDGLSFTINKGDVYGFLGQNGAGKSTTIRMLLGLIHPSEGSVEVCGLQADKNRTSVLKQVGAVVERPDLYIYLSGWNNLKMFAKLSGKKIPDSRLKEVIEIVGLTGREHSKVKAYSQGMKQRLGIAIALVHDPELLILDEPTNGLDPQGIAEIRELIIKLGKEQGKTILISSHLLHEIELMANRMLIIHKGKKVVEGRVDELLSPEDTIVDVVYDNENNIIDKVKASVWGKSLANVDDNVLQFKMHANKVPELTKALVSLGLNILEIRSKHSLEAYFLSLTNQIDAEARAI